LPAPIDLAGVPAPKTPDNSIEAISWRRLHRDQGKGAFALPFLGTIPSTRERVTPLGTPTNPARIGCRHLAEDGSLPGVCRHPRTRLVRPGELPLHRHRTMPNLAARLISATPWRPCHGDDCIETKPAPYRAKGHTLPALALAVVAWPPLALYSLCQHNGGNAPRFAG
jgi:hypothetical protein